MDYHKVLEVHSENAEIFHTMVHTIMNPPKFNTEDKIFVVLIQKHMW